MIRSSIRMLKKSHVRCQFTACLVLLLPVLGQSLITHLDPRQSKCEAALHAHLSRLNSKWTIFPHWNRVGRVGDGTGVYMGDGVVWTASHVEIGGFTPADGHVYQVVPGSIRTFANRDGSRSDLSSFKILIPPNSPLSRLGTVNVGYPSSNSPLLMIGAGTSRKSDSLEWIDDGCLRWGLNNIAYTGSSPYISEYGANEGYYTDFGREFLDCQGGPGDSGGAAFCYDYNSREWKLAGILIAASVPPDAQKTELGDLTFIAKLNPAGAQPEPVRKTAPVIEPEPRKKRWKSRFFRLTGKRSWKKGSKR